MKKILVLTFLALFILSAGSRADDSVKTDPDKKQEKVSTETKKPETRKYDNFIDQNKNGINDKDEQTQKETTRVEPKREQTNTQKTEPDNTKVTTETKSDSASKKTTTEVEKAEQK